MDNIPLPKLAKIYLREKESFSYSDDIPLWELSKRLNQSKHTENKQGDTQSETELKKNQIMKRMKVVIAHSWK